MITTWHSQEAKNRFGELIEKTLSEGPQLITRRGVPVVTVVPATGFKAPKKRDGDLASFFLNSPLVGLQLDLVRHKKTEAQA